MPTQFRAWRVGPYLAMTVAALMIGTYVFAAPRIVSMRRTGGSTGPLSQPDLTAAQTYQHIFLIVEANHSEAEILGSPAAPYINGTLIAHGALAANYYAADHPDLPDALALTSGSEWGDVEDTTPQAQTHSGPVIADEFQSAGVPWRAYVQGMPTACDLTANYSSSYDVDHNPFMYFSELRSNRVECDNDVPFTRMAADLRSASTTPAFAYIVPSLENDMNSDGGVRQGDAWLAHVVPEIERSPACQTSDCLVAVTWDQDDGSDGNNVPTIFYGAGVPQGYRSAASYNQYSLLRTIENNFGLAPMTANDAEAAPMTDMLGSGSGSTPTPPTTTPSPGDPSSKSSTDTSSTAAAGLSSPAPAASSPTAPASSTSASTASPSPSPSTPAPTEPTPVPATSPTPAPTSGVCLLVVCLSLGL